MGNPLQSLAIFKSEIASRLPAVFPTVFTPSFTNSTVGDYDQRLLLATDLCLDLTTSAVVQTALGIASDYIGFFPGRHFVLDYDYVFLVEGISSGGARFPV